MSDASPRVSTSRLILVPAILTLGVTLLRLYGEIEGWNPKFFSREAGGGGALVGISWLPFVFGIWFAAKLAKAGLAPASTGRAIGFALAGIAVAIGATIAAFHSSLPILQKALIGNVAMVVGGVIASRGWPALARVDLAYGLLARIPVALVALIAMHKNWGTHYEKGPPGMEPMPLLKQWFMLGLLPQMFLWVAFTVMAGGLVGALLLPVLRPKARAS